MELPHAVDAGFWRRVAALLLDAGLSLAAFAAANLVLFKLGLLPAPSEHLPRPLVDFWLRPGVSGTLAAGWALLLLGCWRWLKGTPGALLVGLNVVRARDGGVAGLPRLVARLVIGVSLCGLGLLWCVGGRPALHDRLSGTRAVLEDERLLRLPPLPEPRP